jgi:pilus assembly protein FimV
MYITCEQCSTIFRLDEKRLKSTGSKVRCCQCRNVFVAWPASTSTGAGDTMDMEDATAQFAANSPAQQPEDTFDQELEGIDLAELDSILDQERSGNLSAPGDDQGDRTVALAAEETGALDESDLDLDFESELALDDDRPADSAVDADAEPDEDLDLDMDFELDAATAPDAPELSGDDQVAEDELDMDFELGDDLDQQVDAQELNVQIDEAGESLGDDIDSVLDGFEDVLNDAEAVEEGASPESAEAKAGEPEEDIDLSDLGDALEEPDDTGSAAEEIDMGDFETALDMPSEEEETAGADDFDIDLSDLDMDLDMEEEEAQEETAEEATPIDSDSGPSLDEELTLDEASEPPAGPAAVEEEAPTAEPEEEEVFDLSDLDGLMDLDEEEGEAAEEVAASDEDTELSLDDLTLDESAAPSAGPAEIEEEAPTAEPEADEEEVFDLSDLDGLMDLDEEEGEAEEATDSGDGDTELSLDEDLSLDLEEEPAGGALAMDDAAEAESSPEDGADELDLSDLGGLDTMLDEDQPTEDSELEDLELSLDDESDGGAAEDQELTLEMEDGSVQADGQADDELDLGGMDSLLDEEESGDETELEDLELSLDDESDSESAGDLSLDLSPDDETGESEDLEFSLDSEFEDGPAPASDEQTEEEEPGGEDEELDLTDLEQMLENETLVPDLSPQGQESELSLTGKDEKFTDRAAETLGMGSGAELDLSEIEAAIDSADEDTDVGGDEELDLELDLESPEAAEGQEAPEATDEDLELDLEMESDAAGGEEETAGDDDQEAIDLSDLNLSMEDEKTEVESEVVDAGDMELEFQIEDEMEPATIDSAETMPGDVTTASYAKTEIASDKDTSLIEEAFSEQPGTEKEEEKPAAEKKKKAKKKKGSNAALIIILILVLLGAGGFFGYRYVVENNIQIPYLNNLIHPQPQDPNGTAKLTTLDINSKFIDNEKGGRIFVVTGKVRNGYSVACNKIKLQGKLFTKGKVLAKTEQSYAGVVINDLELASQDVAQIKQRLKTGGGQTAELVANPGQTIPFMVVFSDLPEDLDEFAIELMNSTKVQ